MDKSRREHGISAKRWRRALQVCLALWIGAALLLIGSSIYRGWRNARLYYDASRAWSNGSAQLALAHLEQLLRNDINHEAALALAAAIHQSTGDYHRALGCYRRAAALNPTTSGYPQAITQLEELLKGESGGRK